MKKIHSLAAVLSLGILLLGLTEASSARNGPSGRNKPSRRRVLIGFKDGTGHRAAERRRRWVREYGGEARHSYRFVPAAAANLSETQISRLRGDPRVAYIEEDGLVHALDAELDDSWGVKHIGAGNVHSYNKGAGVKVAIIDTGIDYTHVDLDDNYAGGYNFVYDNGDPMDDHGHGTHCAGIVAAEDNGEGVVGVAPEASLYGVKVLNSRGSGYLSDVVAGIQWAIENNMDIISMSLGTDYNYQTLQNACDQAAAAGVILVAAAGNDYSARWGSERDTVDYPARYDSVIAVGATGNTDTKASFSSTGLALELAAPGVSIKSTYKGGGYAFLSGTSMACPHVAGTAALILAGPGGDVRTILQDTADDLGDPGWDRWYGFGLVDADEAAGALAGPPVADFIGGPPSGDVPLTVQFMDLSTGDITNWSWNFGDGEGSTDRDPSHEYQSDGSFTVSLTVTGPAGSDTETKVNYITVSTPVPPVAAFSGSPTSGEVPLAVQFTDESTGSITNWSWDFGDQTGSTEQNPSHTYENVGDYTVSLTVTGPTGSDTEEKQNYINITMPPAPTAAFAGVPTSGDVPLTVEFSDQSSGSITNWSWDFGDQTGSTEQNPSHTYENAGDYTVSLTVTGPGGSDNEVKADYITVTAPPPPPPPPVANFTADPTNGDAPLTVQFTDQSTGSVTDWWWQFGDGETSTEQHPSHTYESGGDYTVGLTATGPGGSDTETKTNYINVTSSGPTEVFFDSFESSYDWTANWSQDSQNDWRRRTTRAVEGYYGVEVDGRASDAQLISIQIDLQGKENAAITFWWYIESGLDTGEYLAFDVSADGGAWQEWASLRGNVDPENTWHYVSIPVSGIDNLMIRFRATMSRSSEDAYVDVVRVVAW